MKFELEPYNRDFSKEDLLSDIKKVFLWYITYSNCTLGACLNQGLVLTDIKVMFLLAKYAINVV